MVMQYIERTGSVDINHKPFSVMSTRVSWTRDTWWRETCLLVSGVFIWSNYCYY